MTIEKMTKMFNMLAEQKHNPSPEEDLSLSHKKIGKAMRILKDEINRCDGVQK